MDKKFVKRKVNEFFGRYEYKELLERIAEAIVTQHEAEVADAIARTRAEMVGDVQRLEAHVALMGDLLKWANQLQMGFTREGRSSHMDKAYWGVATQKALSAAPRVLWEGKAKVFYEEEQPVLCISYGQDFELVSGFEHDVLVLAQEQES